MQYKKTEAVSVFLENMKDARAARRRLFEMAATHPEMVLEYIEALPAGAMKGDELLRKLERIALSALGEEGEKP